MFGLNQLVVEMNKRKTISATQDKPISLLIMAQNCEESYD